MPLVSTTPRWPYPASGFFWLWRGIGWDVSRTPSFKTTRQEPISGRATHIQGRSRSLDTIKLTWWARDDMDVGANATRTFPTNEARILMAFFRARKGAFEAFGWPDPTDQTVTDEVISAATPAVGADPTNPDSRNYQIVRTLGGITGGTEPVGLVNEAEYGLSAAVVKDDGTPVTYVANTPRDGWIRLTTAPGTGSVLTFTGSYLQRVTFQQDEAEFHTFAKNFWELRQILLRHKWW